MATKKCHNTECDYYKEDSSTQMIKNHCRSNNWRDITKCSKVMLTQSTKAWAKDLAHNIMLVSEAYKAGLLKPGVKIKTNANADITSTEYFTATISKTDNCGRDMWVKRDDRDSVDPNWFICTNNTRATIEILENEDKKVPGVTDSICFIGWNCKNWHTDRENNCRHYDDIGDCGNIKKQRIKENKNMKTDGQGNANALEKQFGEEKNKDVKVILKHCQFNLPGILLDILLEEKADKVKAYAMDLEKKEIEAAAEANKSCKSGE